VRIAGSDLAALSSEEQELVMKIRHVFRALTVAAMTCGMAAGASVVRAQDHHDPYLSNTSPQPVEHTSPQPVEQTSPQAVEPAVIEQTSPQVASPVSHSEQKDPYIAATSPKKQKVSHHKTDNDNVTIVGCFYRNVDKDGDHAHYMIGDAKMGPATAVRDQNCTPSGGQAIKLKDADDVGLTQVASNRWVELYGELDKKCKGASKFEVKSFREVPLAPAPRIAIFIPPAPPAAAPAPAVETPVAQETVPETPRPMATTGQEPVKRLPKTASELPLIALLGLFALTGGVVLGLVDRQKAFGRG
jgi:hypothetical protein